jgi:hypothetical protein
MIERTIGSVAKRVAVLADQVGRDWSARKTRSIICAGCREGHRGIDESRVFAGLSQLCEASDQKHQARVDLPNRRTGPRRRRLSWHLGSGVA